MAGQGETHSNDQDIPRRNVLATAAIAASGFVSHESTSSMKTPSIYERLGVKRVINAAGTLTVLGGSLVPPEVAEAWADASHHFVDLVDLQNKVGQRIAELIGVEAALVTTGAAGAMQLATAAVLTRGDAQLVRRLPDTMGMKNEVVCQVAHEACYDNQITACGARIIRVKTVGDLERAIGDRTAMMLFYNLHEPDGEISRSEWLEVAARHKIPTLLDAAADVPPVDSLSQYCKMGFDLVAFSGGKALRGPNNTGLLLGRKQLIDAAKANTSPVCGCVGRGLKVSKEDMVALFVAVERYVQLDHAAEWREWERRIGVIEQAVRGIDSVTTERIVPPIANHVPHVLLFWDESRVKISRQQVTKQLAQDDPPIVLGRVGGTGDRGLLVSVFVLQPDEVEVVAKRLSDVLRAAAN